MDPETEAAVQEMSRAIASWGCSVEEFCAAALELVCAMPTIDPLAGRNS